jgi:hypothetical protein
VIGNGGEALPVMEEVKRETERRKTELLILPTIEPIEVPKGNPKETNAILHITC